MMHDIVYYAATFLLVVYGTVMAGALTLSLADDDMEDSAVRPILFGLVCVTMLVAVLMAVFHG
jgi:hypothetical protein